MVAVAVDIQARQAISAAPSGSGIDSKLDATVTATSPDGAPLAVDTAAGGAPTTASFVVDTLTSSVITRTSIPLPSASDASDADAVGASSHSIPLGTVIGSCVGAFIGAALLILAGVFYYRRYSRDLKSRAARRIVPRSMSRNGKGGTGDDRRTSGQWNRLEESNFEDKWEGMKKPAPAPIAVPQQPNLLPPLDKMDMFNKSPSEVSHRSEEQVIIPNHPYGQATSPTRMPEPRELLGREPLGPSESAQLISWASDNSKPSFLHATRIESGSMSPTIAMAIPTPPATRSQPHHWESAEVIHVPESAEIVDNRSSTHNPFFGGGSGNRDLLHKRSRSQSQSSRSGRSRSNSNATITQQPTSATLKSPELPDKKDRVVSIDPFKDPMPLPSFIRHQPTGSASSAADNERAIKNFMAATGMDLDHDEVQRRLKAVSMQPSVISNSGDSMYTDAEPDLEDRYRAFPKPPSSSGHTAR